MEWDILCLVGVLEWKRKEKKRSKRGRLTKAREKGKKKLECVGVSNKTACSYLPP